MLVIIPTAPGFVKRYNDYSWNGLQEQEADCELSSRTEASNGIIESF
jgi:hypothetical protein